MSKASSAYARATYAHAVSLNQVDHWCEKMHLLKTIKHAALKNPLVPNAVIQCLVESLDLSQEQQQWLERVKKDKCLHLIHHIATQFIDIYLQNHQITPVHIVTANILSDSEKQRVQKQLTQLLRNKVALQFTVNPSIIGGIQLAYSNQFVDLSYAHIINQLHTRT